MNHKVRLPDDPEEPDQRPDVIEVNHDTPTILIVDDIKPEVDYLINFLHEQYFCDFALSGEEALRKVWAAPPDLILLDIIMPGISGYDVCRQLKHDSRTRNIPIIFITSLTHEEEAKGLELGAVDYITKPFRIPVICARIRNHIELKRRGDLLERLAFIDSLTGIANRGRFEKMCDIEWRRAIRAGADLSLIMIDIDFFKSYNDYYGHLAGDNCLKQVARCLSDSLHRAADFIARYGGEEFVALLPETNAAGAAVIAENIRSNIAALNIRHRSTPSGHISISLGAASIKPRPHHDSGALLAAADQALYAAKNKGRNQICSVDLNQAD